MTKELIINEEERDTNSYVYHWAEGNMLKRGCNYSRWERREKRNESCLQATGRVSQRWQCLSWALKDKKDFDS